MFIETVPNRRSPPAVLLRESYREEQGRAQKRTPANLSKLPDVAAAFGMLRRIALDRLILSTAKDAARQAGHMPAIDPPVKILKEALVSKGPSTHAR